MLDNMNIVPIRMRMSDGQDYDILFGSNGNPVYSKKGKVYELVFSSGKEIMSILLDGQPASALVSSKSH
jgi:hypothetical protein